MDYCAGVWGYKEYSKCDTIHNRAIRAFLGVHRYASVPAIQGDTGWLTTRTRRKLSMLRLWHRILSMDDDRITKRVFLWDRQHTRNNWSSEIKQLLVEVGKPELFEHTDTEDISLKPLLDHVTQVLTQKHHEQWFRDIHGQPKLRTYVLFKKEYESENYVSLDLNRSLRSYIAQIRCGILPLRVETGRYEQNGRLPPEGRLCKLCDANVPETEEHFIFQCTRYDHLRTGLLTHARTLNPDFDQLALPQQWILLLTDTNCIRQTARYISDAFQTRNSQLFRH